MLERSCVRRLACLAGACLVLATADSGASDAPPLGQGVPRDVFFFARWESQPETGFSDRHLIQVRDALEQAGIIQGFVEVLRSRTGEEDRERFDVEAAYWRRVLDEVPWWRLVEREGVLAGRAGPTGRFELLGLFRMEGGDEASRRRRDRALRALREVLHGLGGIVPGYELLESSRRSVPTTVLYSLQDPGDQICLGGYEDVVAVSTAAGLLRQSLALLAQRGSEPALRNDDAYRRNRELFSGPVRQHADGALELLYRPGDAFEGIRSLRVVESWHLMGRQNGDRFDWELRYRMNDEGENLLARAFEDQRPVDDLLRRVPRGVRGFTVQAGADPSLRYEYVLDLLAVMSGGPLLPEALAPSGDEGGFDPTEDLLRFLTGRSVTLVWPAGDEAPGPHRAWVFELREGGEAEIARRLDRLAGALGRLGVPVTEVRPEGTDGVFRAADTESLLGRRVHFGVDGGELVVANSSAALVRALERPGPGGPSVLDDDAFRSVWEDPGEPLDEVDWGEVALDLEALGKGLRLVGGLARLLPDRGDAGFLKPALVILPRFREAIEALSFLGQHFGVVTRDGLDYRGHGTIRLRERGER